MGIYLLVLGIADAAFSGFYCKHRFSWLTGTTCKVMGVFVVISSEVSVMTMVLLTASRLYTVTNVIIVSSSSVFVNFISCETRFKRIFGTKLIVTF